MTLVVVVWRRMLMYFRSRMPTSHQFSIPVLLCLGFTAGLYCQISSPDILLAAQKTSNTITTIQPTIQTDVLGKSEEECRKIFHSKGQGGAGEIPLDRIQNACEQSLVFGVCDDLKKFSGLTEEEFFKRIQREGRFHFEGEHAFWNPQSKTELAWFYASSVDYLFANSIHGVNTELVDNVASKEYEPVLEYSGGVGNNMLYLAKKGIKVHYFGIGHMEYSFAQYRAMKHEVEALIEFKQPYSSSTNYNFDPINGPLPQDGSLGAIIALDVLEHIPDYHLVVQAMVKSLRVGGKVVEVSPFDNSAVSDGEIDVRVHVSNGGISMKEAMGPTMQLKGKVWEKIE